MTDTEVIKDYYWFWKNWLANHWKVVQEFTEESLTIWDLSYIDDCKTKRLYILGIQLDRMHNQTFAINKYTSCKRKKYYDYEWRYFTMTELVQLSWIQASIIHWRLNRWMSLGLALTKTTND